jgi:hypothetical protein
MEYESLKIRLHATGRGSYGVLASTATAEAASQFRLPFDERDLENFVLKVGRPRRGVRRLDSPEMGTAKSFGGELFEALFGGEVRDLYHAASAETDSAGKGLRITLLLGQTPELMNLPWEYLCEDGRFLSVSERTPIVRYLDLKKAHKPFRVEPPLRIVGMVSSPSDVVELNVEEEKRRLEDALADLVASRHVEIVWLEKATLGALLRALEEDDFHVFHYIGHGAFDEQAGDGVLMLEDDRGRGKPVTGMYLGQLLQDERTLQLAVLNACEGARSDREDAFGGVAASLVKNEIPSVVAMQFEITDDAAILFADGFYSALARGAPVDAALAGARKAIWADYNDIEWGTPVLFMRVPDGQIFDVDLNAVQIAQPAGVDEDALGVTLLADPDTVNAGDEVSWLLTITNRGDSILSGITAVGSDGSTLVEESELRPGRKSVTRWRTKPKEDAEATVTVRATDSRGDRIAEQVTAHIRVQSPVDGVEMPTTRREPPVKPRAKTKTRPTGESSSKRRSDVTTPTTTPGRAARRSPAQKSVDRPARKANQRARQRARPKGAEPRRELIIAALAALKGAAGVYFIPDVPEPRLSRMAPAAKVPEDEEIVVLVDLSLFSGGKAGLLFGLHGIYNRNVSGAETPITYEQLKDAEIADSSDWSRRLAVGSNGLRLSGMKFPETTLVEALRTLQRMLRDESVSIGSPG